MIKKILGLVLINPILSLLLGAYSKKPIGCPDSTFVIDCFIIVLLLECFAFGLYLFFEE